MPDVLLGLVVGGLLLLGATVAIRVAVAERWRSSLVPYRLTFPRGLTPEAITAAVVGLTGIVAPRARRPWTVRAVVIEVVANTRISHRLLVSEPQREAVLAALRAAVPGVRLEVEDDPALPALRLATSLGISTPYRPLHTGGADVPTALLAALQPLGPDEQAVIHYLIAPQGPVGAVQPASPTRTRGLLALALERLMNRPVPTSGEALVALRAKHAQPLFTVFARIGVSAASRERSRSLLARIVGAYHVANAPGVHLKRTGALSTTVVTAMAKRSFPVFGSGMTLNAAEVAILIAFPVGDVALPGLSLGTSRQLAPSPEIPTRGRLIGTATFPGAERPIALSERDSRQHVYAIGPTGVGKSTLLLSLLVSDMVAGRGVVLIDPKGDLVEDTLDRVPAHRIDDVVVIDPSDDLRPVGLNVLTADEGSRELVVEEITGIFASIFRANWGPRSEDVFRASLLTLAGQPGMSLVEVLPLLNDPAFRQHVLAKLDDHVGLRGFWTWYDAMSDGERSQITGPLANKLRSVVMRRRLRTIVGQAHPVLNLDEALTQRKIIVCQLSKGLIGEEAAALCGSLLLSRVWQAVLRRASQPADQRPATMCFVDEVQDFVRNPASVEAMLTQGRGLGLACTFAHQHLGQMPAGLREAVLANTRSKIFFQLPAADAKVFARDLLPMVTAADLQGLGAHEVIASLLVDNRVMAPVSARTFPPPPPTGFGALARQRSRERYGVDRDVVEAEIRARHEGATPAGAIGRRQP